MFWLSFPGDPKDKFSIQWEPKVLNTQGVATVYWDLVARKWFIIVIARSIMLFDRYNVNKKHRVL